jgi:hypothetical protein
VLLESDLYQGLAISVEALQVWAKEQSLTALAAQGIPDAASALNQSHSS